MNSFPSKDKIQKALKKLDNVDSSKMLPPNADRVDHFKFSLCREILEYKLDNELTLDEMAEALEIGKTDVSKIVNYHIERYTLDKLIRLVVKIKPDSRYGKIG
jgi:predicted XRE-type DNA-binding protein